MNEQVLRDALSTMARVSGLDGCALVEVDTGMVWAASGQQSQLQHIAEVSSDYWRLYQRQRHHFTDLGPLRAQVIMHATGRITMLPCTDGMLLIAISRESESVNWTVWQERVHAIKRLLTLG